MIWPEEIQLKYDSELNNVACGMVNVVYPDHIPRITDLIYKKNAELNELMNNPEGTKQEYFAQLENLKSELSALIEQDNKIIEDNQNSDITYQNRIIDEINKNKENIENKWIAVRNTRNYLLYQCDWTQLPDVPLSDAIIQNWAEYRTLLRNLTDRFEIVESIEWPIKPE